MNPRVSIVIPSYNHANYVKQTIQSVLDQSFQEFEILITDDASTDRTPEVVREFSDPRVKLEVFKTNRGAVAALNSAILRSKGEFICYLASDDYFLPGKLKKQVAYLDANANTGAVFGLPQYVNQRGEPLGGGYRECTYPFSHRNISRAVWLKHFFFVGNCLCHPAAMVRRSVFDKIGFFDPRYFQLPDFEMWIRLSMEYEIHVLQDELTAFRQLDNAQNVSARRRDSALRTVFERFQTLNLYRNLSGSFLREVFADVIAKSNIDASRSDHAILAEVAFASNQLPLIFFGLNLLHETSTWDEREIPRLNELSGQIDLFAIETRNFMRHLERLRVSNENLYNQVFQTVFAVR